MYEFEDVCAKKGRKRRCDGGNILTDPSGQVRCISAIPSTGAADLVNQSLMGRVISIAERGEDFFLGLQWGGRRATEVAVVLRGGFAMHGHVA